MEAARAIKLEADESAWDVELLLSVKWLPWDGKGRDPTMRVSMPRRPLSAGVPLPTEPRVGGDGVQGGVPGPRRVYIRKNVEIRKYGQTPGRQGCLAFAKENTPSISQRRMQEMSGMCNALRRSWSQYHPAEKNYSY